MAAPDQSVELRGVAPAPRSRIRTTLARVGFHAEPVVAFALLLAIWTLGSILAPVPEYALPTPRAVFEAFEEAMAKGTLFPYVRGSVVHLAVACVIGLAVAIPFGFAIGSNRVMARLFYPLFNFVQSLPGIAWLPLLIVWFGFSDMTIVTVVAYSVVFPATFSTIAGVRTIPQVYKRAVLTLGGSARHLIFHVVVPGALASTVTGMRLGIAFGWRALIAAEMIVAANGLGLMIFESQQHLVTERIILGMILIGLLWTVIDQMLLRPLERATVDRWQVHR